MIFDFIESCGILTFLLWVIGMLKIGLSECVCIFAGLWHLDLEYTKYILIGIVVCLSILASMLPLISDDEKDDNDTE